MEIKTFNQTKKFFIRALGDLQFGLNSDNFFVEKFFRSICTGEFVAEVILNTLFILSGSCFFACRKISISWQQTGGVNTCTSHTPFLNAYSCSQFVCTGLHIAHELRFIQKESFHLSRHVSRYDTRDTQHVFFIFFFCSRSETTAKVDHIDNTLRRSTEPHEGDSCPEQLLRTGYEPNRIVDNKIIDELENVICNEDDQITLLKLRIMSKHCLTTSHSCLQPKARQKALWFHKK